MDKKPLSVDAWSKEEEEEEEEEGFRRELVPFQSFHLHMTKAQRSVSFHNPLGPVLRFVPELSRDWKGAVQKTLYG